MSKLFCSVGIHKWQYLQLTWTGNDRHCANCGKHQWMHRMSGEWSDEDDYSAILIYFLRKLGLNANRGL